MEIPMRIALRIRTRLLLAFLGIAAIGAATGGMGIYYMRVFSLQSVSLLQETSAPLRRIFSLNERVQDTQILVRDLMLADPSRIPDFVADLARRDSEVRGEVANLAGKTRDPDLVAVLEVFRQNWVGFRQNIDQLLAEARKGVGKNTISQMYGTMNSSGKSIRQATDLLIDGYMGLAAKSVQKSRTLASLSTYFFIAMLSAGFGLSVLLGVFISRSISRPLKIAVDSAASIASGNLSLRSDKSFTGRADEVGDLSRALAAMTSDLNAGMSTLRSSVGMLDEVGLGLSQSLASSRGAVARIAEDIDAVSRQTVEQAAGVEETAATIRGMTKTIMGLDDRIAVQVEGVSSSSASVEQLVGNIGSVAANVNRLGESFSSLLAASEDGKTKLELVNGLIGEISSQSEKLQEANGVVASIASRTNLLAMNAAIEAAHAGESGKGFSVVADEIRKLAESAASQSKEIKRNIDAIVKSIDRVVLGSATASSSFASIHDHIQTVSSLEQEINLALAEQREGSSQVLAALAVIREVSSEVRAGSQELREGSGAIGLEMAELQRMTEILRSAAEGIGKNVREIGESAEAVEEFSRRNRSAVADVEALVGKYSLDSGPVDEKSPQ
jgi:methyl-accepting chemotaxis protein